MIAPVADHALAEERGAILLAPRATAAQPVEGCGANTGGQNSGIGRGPEKAQHLGQHALRLGHEILVAEGETALWLGRSEASAVTHPRDPLPGDRFEISLLR